MTDDEDQYAHVTRAGEMVRVLLEAMDDKADPVLGFVIATLGGNVHLESRWDTPNFGYQLGQSLILQAEELGYRPPVDQNPPAYRVTGTIAGIQFMTHLLTLPEAVDTRRRLDSAGDALDLAIEEDTDVVRRGVQ